MSTCRTPGAVYETEFFDGHLVHRIVFPFPVFKNGMGPERQRRLDKKIHAALLPVIEEFYRDNWQFFAERIIDGERMPEQWEQL